MADGRSGAEPGRRANARPGAALLLAIVALTWAGMVIGVSGLATPIKFHAPSITLPVALDVGRVTFHLFSRVEWGLTLLLVLAAAAARPRGVWAIWVPAGLVAVLVFLQAVWLIPALDARIGAVIAGSALPPSSDHHIYVVTDAAKLIALMVVGIVAARRAA